MSINAINSISDITTPDRNLKSGLMPEAIASAPMMTPVAEPGSEPTKSFGKMLSDAIAEVNQAQVHAGDMTARFAAGEPMDVHQVMIASQEASVALNLAMQVRNKLVDAYSEIMHVNV